jgi:hypothetical protein
MTTLQLKLMAQTKDSTVSGLWLEDRFLCFVIEDGYREKKDPGNTRIPAGTYPISRKTDGTFAAKYKMWIPKLENVKGFEGILIHPGNTNEDTRGCLLPNTSIAYDGKNFVGSGSRLAFGYLWQILNGLDQVQIKITRWVTKHQVK